MKNVSGSRCGIQIRNKFTKKTSNKIKLHVFDGQFMSPPTA